MFWSGRVTCVVCEVAVPRSQARRTLEGGDASVCKTCYDRWNLMGRVCEKCYRPVPAGAPAALLAEHHAIGHTDCGGALLAA